VISFRDELERLRKGLGRVDRQTAWVLSISGLLVFLHRAVGSKRVFRQEFASYFPEYWQEALAWTWWFSTNGIAGFVIPVLILTLIFKKKPSEIGLGLGDVKFATSALLVYVPLVAIGTWVLSASVEFQTAYPHFRDATSDWTLLLVYEIAYLTYWIGWEYLWRGFVMFGTAHTFGPTAIFVQALPFALLHASKPMPEQMLSIIGGIALGAVVWRCRSFWIAVPIHALQMAFLDLWCTLRIRTGVEGFGPGDLIDMFKQ
jgi:hypothetical protein